MNCCWKELMALLPPSVRCYALTMSEKEKDDLVEIRLRIGQKPQFITGTGCFCFGQSGTVPADIAFCVNHVSGFAAYAAPSAAQGYLTAKGGHRIGLCGTVILQNGTVTGLKDISSLCIRVARDIAGIAKPLLPWADHGSILLMGPPGSGKTTLLRDLVRQISTELSQNVAVVDERCEIFPTVGGESVFPAGKRTDVLSGCPKDRGVEQVLRAMSPQWIAVDEITSLEDCRAMERSGYCGASFLATAHAHSISDLKARPVYRALLDSGLFQCAAVLKRDKTYTVERLTA